MTEKSEFPRLPPCPCGCGRREFVINGALASVALLLARKGAHGAEEAAVVPAAPALPPLSFAVNPIKNVVPDAVRPLPLTAVRLTGGPLKLTQELDGKSLLNFEPDRMMFFLRQRAGLEPKAAQGYQGWDGDGNGAPNRMKQLNGHIAGHYLSAVSLMYAATGDGRFKERADYLVKELKEVQDKYGDGYIGAQTDNAGTSGRTLYEQIAAGTIRSGNFELNGMWSPWYVQHKIFAGLRDTYRYTGNRTALEVEIKFAGWVEKTLAGLSEAQLQRMLAAEFGGINETLADLYADTGDERWLRLSGKFEHQSIINPLAEKRDILGGKHGNTLVPKIIGELARYRYAGDKTDGEAAKFFWDAVVNHHSFATGGHGYDEYFGPPDKLSGQVDGSGQRSTDLRTCESCNVYNMLRFTRMLFALEPDDKYAEFHERALFNHVLASIDFNTGQVCYMVPVSAGVTHEYQGATSFTCCVGSGMESHALHGDGLYYEADNKFWVNIYAPSTAQWKQQGVDFTMETNFPEGEAATLKVAAQSPKEFTLALRRPAWAGDGFAVKVNGEPVKDLPKPGSYVDLKRTWKTGDTVALTLPKTLRKEALPDNPNRLALMWGPLVLGADLGAGGNRGGGRRGGGATTAYPVFLAKVDEPVGRWLKTVAAEGQPVSFHATGVGGTSNEVDFRPFYQLSQRRYGIYWDVYTPEEWQQKGGELDAATAKRVKLQAATVAYAQPGQMQPETDFNFRGEDAVLIAGDNPGRRGSKWFSFELPVESAHPMVLMLTYHSGEAQARSFQIAVDGTRLKTETVAPANPANFYDVEYVLPPALVQGKQNVTVRFDAAAGSEVPGIYGIRMIRGDAER